MLKFLHNAIAYQCKMFEIILNVELLEKCIKEKKQIENNDESILWFIELELETDVSTILSIFLFFFKQLIKILIILSPLIFFTY